MMELLVVNNLCIYLWKVIDLIIFIKDKVELVMLAQILEILYEKYISLINILILYNSLKFVIFLKLLLCMIVFLSDFLLKFILYNFS
jgi:hypothetical protein